MDFFAAQELARKRSRTMVLLFMLAVLTIAVAVYGLIIFVTGSFLGSAAAAHSGIALWQPGVFFKTLAAVAIVVAGCSIYKIAQLRSGGSFVARSLGGSEVLQATGDAKERMLLNIVEEMSIASGVPMPEVYLLPEDGINAFAAGFNPSDAVVAVTRGCLDRLSRDELQGVVAHEFSHILNGDMRMNIRLMGVLFGILAIAVLGRIVLRLSGNARGRNGGAALLLVFTGLGVLVIGYIGVFFGRIIQSAISRQREFLADAAAVQFTRNPEGIAGALKKIGGSSIHGRVMNAHSQETAHFFFVSALKSNLAGLFATHPPLDKRILAIQPNWDGTFAPTVRRKAKSSSPMLKKTGASSPLTANDFVNAVGQTGAVAILAAQRLHEQIGSDLARVRNNASSARGALLGLCISASSPEDNAAQLLKVKQRFGDDIQEETRNWLPRLLSLDINQRFALFDIALPLALGRDFAKALVFCELLKELAHSDGKVNFQELALVRGTKIFVRERNSPQAGDISAMHPKQMEMPLCVLISAVAHAACKDANARERAFKEGARKCNRYMLKEAILLPEEMVDFESLETALDLLAKLPSPQKKTIFEGVLAVVLADKKVTRSELCLIRVIAISMGLPIPPLIAE